MRLFAIATTALFIMTALAALAPTGSAVGWCSQVTDRVRDQDCQHFICWGRSTGTTYGGYRYERCQISEDDIPDPCWYCCICDPWYLP